MNRFRSLNLRRRAALFAFAALGAALVAAGCGSDSDGGGGGKATSAKGLDFVPKGALLYLVADTDFSGDSWQQFDKLAQNFNGYDAGKKDLLKEINKGDDGITYDKDIKPWLGSEVGVAVISVKSASTKEKVFEWVAVKDEAKAEKTIAKNDKVTSTGKVAGVEVKKDVSKDDTTYFAFKDKVLVVADERANLVTALKTADGGSSITDADGVKDVASHVDKDAIGSIVVNGSAVKSAVSDAVKSSSNASAQQLSALTDSKLLKAMQGLSLSLVPEDKGFHLAGYVGFDKDELGSQKVDRNDFDPTILKGLPADTVLALGGNDLGGQLKSGLGQIEDAQPNLQTQITQLESVIGVKLDDIADALGGQFAIGVQAGAGTPAIDAVFEAKDESATSDTLSKLFGAVGTLTGGAAKPAAANGVQQLTIAGQTISESVQDGKAIITTAPSGIDAIAKPDSTLGDSDQYKRLVDESGMPDKVGGLVWINTQALLAYSKSSSLSSLAGGAAASAANDADAVGPLLGWLSSGDDHIGLDLFAEIDKDAASNASAG